MFTYLSANLSQSLGQLEATMLSAFSRAAKLKQWIARPDCPAFLKECKRYFDKAFSATPEDSNHVADSAFRPVPAELRATIPAGPKVAIRARHLHDGVVFSRSRTHVGNSLIMYYPDGNRQDPPIPAEIENIVVGMDQRYTYVVRRQLPAPPGTVDPFAPYLHFPAKVFSSKISSTLETVSPEWVMSHYARWKLDKDRVVVLNLSRVRKVLHTHLSLSHLRIGLTALEVSEIFFKKYNSETTTLIFMSIIQARKRMWYLRRRLSRVSSESHNPIKTLTLN